MKKRLLSQEVRFCDPIQFSTIKSLKKQGKVISVLKKNRQALELFVKKSPEKHEAFKYPLATVRLEGILYQPKTKYHFRDYFIELSNAKVS